MKLKVPGVMAMVALGLLAWLPNNVRGQSQSEKIPFLLESGKYQVKMVFLLSSKDTEEKIDYEADLTVKKDGSVTLVDPKQPEFPIVGTLEKRIFTAKLDDAAGTIIFKGKLSGNNELTGTLIGTHRDGKTTVKGTFKFAKPDH